MERIGGGPNTGAGSLDSARDACFTRMRSLVQIQYRPPRKPHIYQEFSHFSTAEPLPGGTPFAA
jgi:hypothetical protein